MPDENIPIATPLGDGAWLLDTRFDGSDATVGVYLVPHAGAAGRAGRYDLVEAGPAVSEEAVLRAIAVAGFEPDGLDTVVVTHVHLDHAGAAGGWAARGARVMAHARGAPHLADPSRLLSSARRVYGDALEARWGRMVPVPAARLQAVEDGEEPTLGGRPVRVLHAPGHASHHAVFLWPDGVLYTGDAAGIRLPGSDVVRPALPPPETDLEAWDETLARLAELEPSALRLTHYGQVDDAAAHLAAVGACNRAWAEAVLGWVADGMEEAAIAERIDDMARRELVEAGADERTIARHLATSDAAMTTTGVLRYWRTRRPDRWREATGDRA